MFFVPGSKVDVKLCCRKENRGDSIVTFCRVKVRVIWDNLLFRYENDHKFEIRFMAQWIVSILVGVVPVVSKNYWMISSSLVQCLANSCYPYFTSITNSA